LDLEQLKQLLDLVREHQLAEIEIEHEGLRVKIRKDVNGAAVVSLPPAASTGVPGVHVQPSGPASLAAASLPPTPASPDATPLEEDAAEIELAVVKSPIVGTFYRSPEPGTPSFVEVGSTVKKGQVLCIIEAMKLMNEIDSEYDGEVVNIYVDNAQPVQYGERLFAIRTK
jgi:acetyl-CoA carboxylase biotin carboxyl carrier protein